MSRPTENAGLKRKRAAAPTLVADPDVTVLNAIKSKTSMGIWVQDIKRETSLAETVVKKSIKSLLAKGTIKEVVNIKFKKGKHYMAIEFQPSDEISGGLWYNAEGNVDKVLLNILKKILLSFMDKGNVVTSDTLCDMVNKKELVTFKCTNEHVDKILKCMVLDKQIQEVKSTGRNEFRDIPKGTMCYRSTVKIKRWYNDKGRCIDNELIDELKRSLKDECLDKWVTSDKLYELVEFEWSAERFDEFLKYMVSKNEIKEVESDDKGEFGDIPKGTLCYRVAVKKTGAMASIPCGTCQRISLCTADGVISPSNCVYYKKWLDF